MIFKNSKALTGKLEKNVTETESAMTSELVQVTKEMNSVWSSKARSCMLYIVFK
jgi:hypothetical protein